MDVTMRAVSADDAPQVVTFLTGNTWPYHGASTQSAQSIGARIAAGWLDEAGTETYWIDDGDRSCCGLLRLFDLDDGTPLFDLRLAEDYRGRGLGTKAVRQLTDHVFGQFPATNRIEATTRVDNIAMRRALVSAGWVKESNWRQAWTTDGGRYDAVGYGVLRSDIAEGTTTPVHWDS